VCGICGKVVFDKRASVSPRLVKAMGDALEHRGPDDEGYYVAGPIGLGFRRLSIIDLTTGHQPISNEDGTICVIFNGEIYNYKELRLQLMALGHIFKTDTDTEVIVHLYEDRGERCVEQLRGMFAFALWDERSQTLFLARDRLGIKPLYYYLSETCLSFASEIKGILADPEVNREIVPGIIDRFLTFHYVPGDETLFKNIRKLMPGFYMTVRGRRAVVKQYWDLTFTPSNLSLPEAETQLIELLEEAVHLHMISDVPIGFLLSGGLDSTALLSIAATRSKRKMSSFTVGFSGTNVVDERPYARLVAKHFGTEHHEITITSKEFESFLPKYVWHMEEPVCEPPAIALYYVSKLARNFVKVLISGEGGDEAFAGYPDYRNVLWLERWKSIFHPLNGALSASLSWANKFASSARLAKYARLLKTPFESYYCSRTYSPFSGVRDLYSKEFLFHLDERASVEPVMNYLGKSGIKDIVNRMLYVDSKTWLPDDLLIKADKMTMANSIELRVPLLDHRVLEFAASLPGSFKVHGFTTKYIAKKVLAGRVPQPILHRKKAGFPVPYANWLRSELSGWLRDILLDRETLARGYFDKRAIERLISEDQSSGGRSKELFSLAVLELWHRCFLGKHVPSRSSLQVPDFTMLRER
jgi:asparagine synthase (glutamine-hydrolysing)